MKNNYIKKQFELFDNKLFFYTEDFFEFQNIEIPRFSKPKVSIIIPVYNQIEYTLNCIFSLTKAIKEVDYEIIVINDNSNDSTLEKLSNIPNLIIINNEENLGFLRNINKGIQKSHGEYVLLFNNDIIVFPNFLEQLINVFKTKESVGAVGSMLIFENLSLQESGVYLKIDGNAESIGRTKNPLIPNYNYLKEVDYCSGCCLLVKKYLPNGDLCLLDEYYLPAYYEETDLCMKLKNSYNLKIIYQPESKVIHFESISYSSEKNNIKSQLLNENKIKFHDRWKNDLIKINTQRDQYFNKVIFFSEITLQFNEDLIFEILLELSKKNKVIYLTDKHELNDFHKNLQQNFIEVIYKYKNNKNKYENLKKTIKTSLKDCNNIEFIIFKNRLKTVLLYYFFKVLFYKKSFKSIFLDDLNVLLKK